MRTAIMLLAVVLVAGTARADGDHVWGAQGGGVSPFIGSEFDYFLRIIGNPAPTFIFQFSDLDQSDAGMILTIDETTSASYGVDWALFAASFDAGRQIIVQGGTHPLAANTYEPHEVYSHGFVINSMEWEFSVTENTSSYGVHPTIRMYVSGAPEPSSGLLLLIGLCFAGLHRSPHSKACR